MWLDLNRRKLKRSITRAKSLNLSPSFDTIRKIVPTHPDDSTLLGYLLKALEPYEMEEVRLALEQSDDLRARLKELQLLLRPLDEDKDQFEPSSV